MVVKLSYGDEGDNDLGVWGRGGGTHCGPCVLLTDNSGRINRRHIVYICADMDTLLFYIILIGGYFTEYVHLLHNGEEGFG